MITIKNDGIIEPFGLEVIRDSNFQLISPTRDISESPNEFDGEVDFGTELKNGQWTIVAVTNDGLSPIQKMQTRRTLAGQLNNLRNNGDYLSFESDSGRRIRVRLQGRAEIEEYPSWLKIIITLKTNPYWESIDEKQQIGSGTITNEGTLETPLVIEAKGIVTDPEIIVGGQILKYTGILGASDTLVINSEFKTVTFNGINALHDYEGIFPVLPIGDTAVIGADGGQTIFKWREWFL